MNKAHNKLMVRIPKKHKKQLAKRFNPRSVKLNKPISCPLCDIYFYNNPGLICYGCPFNRFKNTSGVKCGCEIWINAVMECSEIPIILGMERIVALGDSGIEFLIELNKRSRKLIKFY